MRSTIAELIRLMETDELDGVGVLPWSSPVPSFGDANRSRVATLGLNPSNREFVDIGGKELEGELRRFPTLGSLGLTEWGEAKRGHINLVVASCRDYFDRNPYDGWFRALDEIISGTRSSYYSTQTPACHLDLVPYATDPKWGNLSHSQQMCLLNKVEGLVADLLAASKFRLLILNGQSVVTQFERLFDTELKKFAKPEWNLPRRQGGAVKGYAFVGEFEQLSNKQLNRTVRVLGFNHNIQSSFGVTKGVRLSIRDWVTDQATELNL